MAAVDTPYVATWVENLAKHSDPNHVTEVVRPELDRHVEYSIAPKPQSIKEEPSYYDIPMLKAPLWKWEIATYFYLGGLSAGALILSQIAEQVERRRFANIARTGAAVSLITILPCPLLLIHDLGDPKRFHHMLRVWKPSSPMNLGAWLLVAFSGRSAYQALRQYLNARQCCSSDNWKGRLQRILNAGERVPLHKTAGHSLALMLASYSGVLLTCTANPLWCRNPWLPVLFTAGALSSGSAATGLAMTLLNCPDTRAERALKKINTAAHACEGLALRAFLNHAGDGAKPLRTGNQAALCSLASTGIIAAELLKAIPVKRRFRKPVNILAAALGLASGLALRWAIVYGGHGAANDPRTSRSVSKPQKR